MELRLSDAFEHTDDTSGIEFTATMLNINYGHNKELMSACSILEQYAIFIDRVRNYMKPNMDRKDAESAMDKAVKECLEEGVLADFLSAHRAEVKDMILTEYDEAKTMELFKKEFIEDGIAIGRREGEERGKIMIALRLKEKGMPDEELAELMGVTVEQFKSIISSGSVHEK